MAPGRLAKCTGILGDSHSYFSCGHTECVTKPSRSIFNDRQKPWKAWGAGQREPHDVHWGETQPLLPWGHTSPMGWGLTARGALQKGPEGPGALQVYLRWGHLPVCWAVQGQCGHGSDTSLPSALVRLHLSSGKLWVWCVPGPQRGHQGGASPAESQWDVQESAAHDISGEAMRTGFIYPGEDKGASNHCLPLMERTV